MKFWRRTPAAVVVDACEPLTDVPVDGPTEGELARERAEEALDREVERTREVKAQTPAYETLGATLRVLRERNHLREDIYRSIVGSA